MVNHRLQVLLDDERYERVHALARLRTAGFTDPSVHAIESGARAATVEVTEDLERVLPVEGALRRLRDEMGDGLGYQPYPAWFQEWLSYEREATKLRLFGPLLVPGILQTADYARAVFGTRFGVTEDEIEEQVAARLKRQEILERDQPPILWVIIDESVLRRAVGGRHMMREQVGHLIEMARRPFVSVQVISAATGAHRGLWAGGFAVADFENARAVGYQETACQGQLIDGIDEVGTLVECWDTLVREALPWAASRSLLEEAAKSWTSAT